MAKTARAMGSSQRTSVYRGVTRLPIRSGACVFAGIGGRGRFEAHLWDNSCRVEGQKRKGRQVRRAMCFARHVIRCMNIYGCCDGPTGLGCVGPVGGYDTEERAAKSYDLAALKYWACCQDKLSPVKKLLQRDGGDAEHDEARVHCIFLRRRSSAFSRVLQSIEESPGTPAWSLAGENRSCSWQQRPLLRHICHRKKRLRRHMMLPPSNLGAPMRLRISNSADTTWTPLQTRSYQLVRLQKNEASPPCLQQLSACISDVLMPEQICCSGSNAPPNDLLQLKSSSTQPAPAHFTARPMGANAQSSASRA
ncbi:hypothetical protein HPP92_001939 [Vanilla planifolia]|uniref:AP2/ERF domain-containing protein n=1 Tax=Vanilla planifolia TaxID=51239 RepID=A0A835RUY1_VANPL|nr:hypothetical protein HPP92_001939 [Vanilla planifolia]